jgi:hypothetical protein
MTQQDLKGLFDLAKERDQKMYAWLRHLVLLASGALTALVSLHAGAQSTEASLLFVRVAWLALGIGIVLGAFSLHGEVWISAELTKKLGRQLSARPADFNEQLSPVLVTLPARYKWCTHFSYVSLVIAVVALVAYAISRN